MSGRLNPVLPVFRDCVIPGELGLASALQNFLVGVERDFFGLAIQNEVVSLGGYAFARDQRLIRDRRAAEQMIILSDGRFDVVPARGEQSLFLLRTCGVGRNLGFQVSKPSLATRMEYFPASKWGATNLPDSSEVTSSGCDRLPPVISMRASMTTAPDGSLTVPEIVSACCRVASPSQISANIDR